MKITIKYFGLIAEITNRKEETLEFSKSSIADLLLELNQRYPLLNGKDFQVAQNQEIVSKETLISKGEIALLPPFAGG